MNAKYTNKYAIGSIIAFLGLVIILWLNSPEYFSYVSCSLFSILWIGSFLFFPYQLKLQIIREQGTIRISKVSLLKIKNKEVKRIERIVLTSSKINRGIRTFILYSVNSENEYCRIIDSDSINDKKIKLLAKKIAETLGKKFEYKNDFIPLPNVS